MDLRLVTSVFLGLILVPSVLWTSGALYFDLGKRGKTGWIWTLSWLGFVVACIVLIRPFELSALVLLGLCAAFALGWLRQKPSHDRDWDPCFAILPSVTKSDERLVFHDVRFAKYHAPGQYTVEYEERAYDANSVTAVDALIIYWGSDWICHPMAIFQFGDNQHLCFSIEVRYRVGDEYAILPSIYRQHELMYVVSDERDAILRRTTFHSKQIDCYLYRLSTDKDFVQGLLEEYIEATNRIKSQPQWYNAITSNCTTEIFENRREKVPWDWRMLVNGSFDKMLYDKGVLQSELEFEELKRRSRINEAANAASFGSFSTDIRRGLPGF